MCKNNKNDFVLLFFLFWNVKEHPHPYRIVNYATFSVYNMPITLSHKSLIKDFETERVGYK